MVIMAALIVIGLAALGGAAYLEALSAQGVAR